MLDKLSMASSNRIEKMSRWYIIMESQGERYVHGPLNSDGVQNRVELIKRRFFRFDELKVLTESEYFELEREVFINGTGATD